jgi:hypothetical protein
MESLSINDFSFKIENLLVETRLDRIEHGAWRLSKNINSYFSLPAAG